MKLEEIDALIESHKRLELFLQVSRTMNSSIPPNELMQLIVDNAASATGFNMGAIYLLDKSGTIKLEATVPPLPADFPDEFRLAQLSEHPHIVKVFETGEPVILPDTYTASLTDSERRIMQLRRLRSNLYLPISYRNRNIGVLILSSVDEPYNFSDQEIYLLQGFANHAAQIIENNMNFNKLSRYASALEKQIAERRKAEDMLLKEVTRRRVLMEQSRDGIVIIDKEGKVFESNIRFAQMIGYSLEELESLNVVDWEIVTTPENLALMLENLDEKGTFFETRHRRKDGSTYEAEISANAIWFGEQKLIFCVCRDITERKMSEQTQQQLEVARKTILFKQNFLANMSHEIRTPLTGVLGMIDILGMTELNDIQKDYLNTLKTSGQNLKEIINQVLDYSKIEAGKINIYPTIFKFSSFQENALVLFKNIKKDNVSVIGHTDTAIPEFIQADRFRLSQVLNNLVSNAVKFTHQGTVTVKSSLELYDGSINRVFIKIEVTDTGIGIPKSLQQKLFEPFSQIDAYDTRQYEGTGLGLSICKQLILLMGGEIGVTSEEGKGSTFWFTFPAIIAEPPASSYKEGNHSIQQLRILLAEDKLVNQKVITLMLNSMGHTVQVACNGKHVLEMYGEGKFDLLLMDIQMPVMDGVTATRMLKERYQKLVPVVGLSANAFEGDREKYMSLGMDEYLTKPFEKEDFEELIEKLLNKK